MCENAHWKNDFRPTLQVHGTIMPEVTEETYLGDLLTSDGKKHKEQAGAELCQAQFKLGLAMPT